ncbi:MAG: hypothetical protein KF721_03860 [Ignavibacteriaceae bacterium]|nr:hypothetical protein [Ignavibacteriaceae bacterium]HRI47058.1 YkoF family thiamine/hydroxymethylpyrimidine-binding protein [Ignavibacteriaceae bacterium]
MKVGIEISMYPLTENYEPPILQFIAELKQNSNLEIITNKLSTQIFGEFDEITSLVKETIFKTFQKQKSVFVMKWVGGPQDFL